MAKEIAQEAVGAFAGKPRRRAPSAPIMPPIVVTRPEQAMSQIELDQLERDVEMARQRFGRRPGAIAVSRDLVAIQGRRSRRCPGVARTDHAATPSRRRLIAVTHFLEDLKERAAANPTAAFAIGAGVAWRLADPPAHRLDFGRLWGVKPDADASAHAAVGYRHPRRGNGDPRRRTCHGDEAEGRAMERAGARHRRVRRLR